jgi:predicted dehydrogenase
MGERLAGMPGGRALRIGVVGAGFIGVVHARAARRSGARIAGVASSTPESTDQAVVALGAERGFASGDELIASAEIDVVHICTPNHLHHPLAVAAIDAGKHVVCEKPLAITEPDAIELRDRASSGGVIATVPFVYRFYPMVREARARVAAAGSPIRLVHGGYLQDWLSTERDDNWRVDATTSGPSRAFADIGSHWCDLVEFVTGDRVTSVSAQLITAIPERRERGPHAYAFSSGGSDDGPTRTVSTEDVVIMMFRTAAGVPGSLVVSQISSGRKNQLRFEIAGAHESIAFDQEHPDSLWLGRRAGSEHLAGEPGQLDASAARYALVPPGHPHGYQDCFDAFVADTYRAIAAGSTDAIDGLPTFADGARAAQITSAVLASAASDRWVTVASSAPPTATHEEQHA